MPSFSRLLVLAVLALTLSVQSAPIPNVVGTDLGLVRPPMWLISADMSDCADGGMLAGDAVRAGQRAPVC